MITALLAAGAVTATLSVGVIATAYTTSHRHRPAQVRVTTAPPKPRR